MTTYLALLRLRLELDRSLRTRSFFARAIQGRLLPAAYRDLVFQLSSLQAAADGAPPLSSLCNRPPCQQAGESTPHPRPCKVILLYSETPSDPDRKHACALALGTSWSLNAASTNCYPDAFLSQLHQQGSESLALMQSELHAHPLEAERLLALAALAQGAVLGVATYLEAAWVAPLHSVTLAARA